MMESTNAIQEDIETGPKEVVGTVMKSNQECGLKLCFSLIFIGSYSGAKSTIRRAPSRHIVM
jgi:hypothetical protein